jgi:Tol biopolymer transport system component
MAPFSLFRRREPPAAVLVIIYGIHTLRVADLIREVAMTGVLRLARGLLVGLLLAGAWVALIGLAAGPEPRVGRPLPGESLATAAPAPRDARAGTFLVQDPGLSLLGPDGRVKERIDPPATNAARSPDGRWLAGVELVQKEPPELKLVIRPQSRQGEPISVPLVWGSPGQSGCLPVWAPESKRVLIGEERPGKPRFTYRVYELTTQKLTELRLRDGYWVTSWSPDGKRFLTTAFDDNTRRIAWLNADGTGEPEFLTPEQEVARGARLSPDGRRMLYQAGPKVPNGRPRMRLYVMDLSTRKRKVVDEPGETHGFCWHRDGSRVAYTWQRALDKPEQVPERETLLITCNPDGTNRKTITSRKAKVSQTDSVVYFFWVIDWH